MKRRRGGGCCAFPLPTWGRWPEGPEGEAAVRGANGFGTAFKLAPDGTLTVLHAFAGGSDGANPAAGLLLDKAGNLYGATQYGGGNANCDGGCGTIFKLTPDGT